MTLRSKWLWAALLALLSAPALGQSVAAVDARVDALFGNHKALANAFYALKESVAAADAEAVAALARYPFEVMIDGEEYRLRSEQAFAERYEEIITPALAGLIARQSYEDLEVAQNGVYFEDRRLRLTRRCLERGCGRQVWLVHSVDPGPAVPDPAG